MPRGYDDPFADTPAGVPAERRLPGLHDEERLPWLDAGDDVPSAAGDPARAWAGMLVGLAVLLAMGVGGWWIMHRGANGAPLADGSVIAAPPGPIKEAPRDPGGRTFAGTGDSSFAVSQGHSPGVGMGERADEAAPVAAQNSAGGIGVQLGAYATEVAAQAAWDQMVKAYDPLSGAAHRIVEGTADIGTVYRLQVVADSDAAAGALCTRLKAAGLNCQVQD